MHFPLVKGNLREMFSSGLVHTKVKDYTKRTSPLLFYYFCLSSDFFLKIRKKPKSE